MPFDAINAGKSFKHLIDKKCQEIDFVYVYLGDILVFCKVHQAHIGHIRQILMHYPTLDLVINVDKFKFGLHCIDFLGYSVSEECIKLLCQKNCYHSRFPKPSTNRLLMEFNCIKTMIIDLFIHYHQKLFEKQKILTDALSNVSPKSINFLVLGINYHVMANYNARESYEDSRQDIATKLQLGSIKLPDSENDLI
ncbi:hypothetical protein RF11_00326 [Thelohanellus kitauei]|uniref:Reverse transcriptase domain-containing protein n=1 Tax=Thelohanellus kitauei TaxID=669202 RepID=A0A0C2MZ04_THEKT|nr:hypothetical protein RF11_00326 [Thelohanellus kitauei]